MEVKLFEIAERIRCLREILGITVEEMAAACMVDPAEYARLEEGNDDFSYSFLVKCAETLGVDTVELITGETPKLSFYSIIRKGRGLPIKRRKGFTYDHMGYLFRGRECEPMLVVAPYSEEEQNAPIHLSHHSGQEFDYILRGSLRMEFEGGGRHPHFESRGLRLLRFRPRPRDDRRGRGGLPVFSHRPKGRKEGGEISHGAGADGPPLQALL